MHVPLTSGAPSKQAAGADAVLDGGALVADCDGDPDLVPASGDCLCVMDAATLAALLLIVVELSTVGDVGDGVPEKDAPLCDPEAEYDGETLIKVLVVVPVIARVALDERLKDRDAL